MSTRHTLIALALLVACGSRHEPAAIEVGPEDCVPCHRGEYEDAEDPVHVGVLPVTCADCHGTESWRVDADAGVRRQPVSPE